MIKELSIENLAVISSATIPLESQLNVFTGETGAGKSILIHGIQAVLGQRISKEYVRHGCKKAVVSALFSPIGEDTAAILAEYGYNTEDDALLLTREISADGGSIGRINGRTAPVNLLRTLGETLVNIHGQHDNQVLLRPERHLDVLDRFGDDERPLLAYRQQFQALQACARQLNTLRKAEQDKANRLRELREIIEEIAPLDIQPDEDTAIEEQYTAAAKAEETAESTAMLRQMLTEGDENISDAIANACIAMQQLAAKREEATPLYQRLRSVNAELKDIADELDMLGGTMLSPAEFDALNKRRNALNTLMVRYHTDANGLRKLLADAEAEIDAITNSADAIAELTEKKQKLLQSVTEQAKALSAHRQKLAEQFASRVGEELAQLDMPKVRLEVAMTKGKLTSNGMDTAEFLISANPGEPPKPIAQIASGGELSRMMLALKSVIAKRDAIPTLIFDEIDTGVSGRAAQKIGKKLRALAKHSQVICVTHLAQLATQAQHHLLIEKHSDESSTETCVTVLQRDDRIREIARIMSGSTPSDLLLQTAEEALVEAEHEDF
ncbi:MAG: DNA repair protein RecN [Oscillospiraceae bacterium]|nr:DNA repair protein RecN [Oscillospiraceae bacterium]